MKNVSLKSYHLEFQIVSSRSFLLQWLLLITIFCFFFFQNKAKFFLKKKKKKKNKAKLVWKQRCKFKASFFSFFFSGTFSHFCGKLYQYSQFGQIVTYTIYNFLKIQSWCNSRSSLSCHKFSSFFITRRYTGTNRLRRHISDTDIFTFLTGVSCNPESV